MKDLYKNIQVARQEQFSFNDQLSPDVITDTSYLRKAMIGRDHLDQPLYQFHPVRLSDFPVGLDYIRSYTRDTNAGNAYRKDLALEYPQEVQVRLEPVPIRGLSAVLAMMKAAMDKVIPISKVYG
jgi:hypothetical protein